MLCFVQTSLGGGHAQLPRSAVASSIAQWVRMQCLNVRPWTAILVVSQFAAVALRVRDLKRSELRSARPHSMSPTIRL